MDQFDWFFDLNDSVHRLHVCEWALDQHRPDLAFGFSSRSDLDAFRLWFVDQIGLDAWKAAEKFNKALRNRRQRVQKRLQRLLCYPSWFFTLTFSDDVLLSTSADTRRRYVTRYLSDLSPYYVANIDFGKEKGREHYHAVVCVPGADPGHRFSPWPYGFDSVKRIPSEKSDAALARYLVKLGLHATKQTAGRLIYSKALPEPFWAIDSHLDKLPLDFPDEWV